MTFRAYLDFDGTFTDSAEEKTIHSEVFHSLLSYYEEDLAKVEFKPDMRSILASELAKPSNASMKLKPYAVEFLRNASSNGEIVIVSNNRSEYIEAVLAACGLKDDEIKKIIIYDAREVSPLKGKENIVSMHERGNKKPVNLIVVYDNDFDKAFEMRKALDKTKSYVEKSRPIDFKKFEQDIQTHLLPSEFFSFSSMFSCPRPNAKNLLNENEEARSFYKDWDREQTERELLSDDQLPFVLRKSSEGVDRLVCSFVQEKQVVKHLLMRAENNKFSMVVCEENGVKHPHHIYPDGLIDFCKEQIQTLRLKSSYSAQQNSRNNPSPSRPK